MIKQIRKVNVNLNLEDYKKLKFIVEKEYTTISQFIRQSINDRYDKIKNG